MAYLQKGSAMSFADYDEKELDVINHGLNLIGWRIDMRLTSDDASLISDIAYETLELQKSNNLTKDKTDDLALRAYEYVAFQIMNPHDRASWITYQYQSSMYLKDLMPAIDEALICWYRGYYLSASSILFIVIERCMRKIALWNEGDNDITFTQLKNAIKNLPASSSRDEAETILNVIYSRYNPLNPTTFFFNRHSLLHGIRLNSKYDEMNCVRMMLFLDLIVKAEGVQAPVIINNEYKNRTDIYLSCRSNKVEQFLLKRR